MFKILALLGVAFIGFGFSQKAFSQITITQVSDMDFGSGFQGDAAKTIQATNAETAENASFLVTGPGGSPFTVVMPDEVFMITGSGATNNEQIRVFRFRKRPNSPKIRNNGTRMLYVSAKRRALRANQVPGNYAVTFTITVVL